MIQYYKLYNYFPLNRTVGPLLYICYYDSYTYSISRLFIIQNIWSGTTGSLWTDTFLGLTATLLNLNCKLPPFSSSVWYGWKKETKSHSKEVWMIWPGALWLTLETCTTIHHIFSSQHSNIQLNHWCHIILFPSLILLWAVLPLLSLIIHCVPLECLSVFLRPRSAISPLAHPAFSRLTPGY